MTFDEWRCSICEKEQRNSLFGMLRLCESGRMTYVTYRGDDITYGSTCTWKQAMDAREKGNARQYAMLVRELNLEE